MSEVVKLFLVALFLIFVSLLPGLIGFWQLGHSMVLIVLVGLSIYMYESRRKQS